MNEPVIQKIKLLTVEEFFAIYGDNDERYELIDGIAYMMSAPGTEHQSLSMFLSIEIGNFLKGKKCKVFAAPYDVFLEESLRDENGNLIKNKRTKGTVVQPDIMVICDKDKIKKDGCHGAPDFIIEIVSESSKEKDRHLKARKYFKSGVKEYWVVDPEEELVYAYKFDIEKKKSEGEIFTFDDKIKINALDGLEINFAEFEYDL